MIQYVTLGTNNLTAATAFYETLLAEFNAQRVMENERMVFWMPEGGGPGISVCEPFDKQAASVGNGTMVALSAADREQVERVYHKALELGGTSEGEPGVRGDALYAAYFRDLDGNKLVAICFV